EGQARGVQIDIDPKMLSIRYPMEVNLVGDSAATLRALIPLLKRKADRKWRGTIEKNVKDWWKTLEAIAHQDGEPINPQRVFWELSPKLPDRCILVGDSGSGTNWYARDVKLRRGMMGTVSGGLATMGCGGAMQMNGINGLITIAKYWEKWADPRLIVLVLNNEDLNQVTWEMRAMAGDPKFEASQDLPNVHFARYAELVGLKGI